MQVTTTVEPHDVAEEMATDGFFAMDVFASLAEMSETFLKELSSCGGIALEQHDSVPAFLRRLADKMDELK